MDNSLVPMATLRQSTAAPGIRCRGGKIARPCCRQRDPQAGPAHAEGDRLPPGKARYRAVRGQAAITIRSGDRRAGERRMCSRPGQGQEATVASRRAWPNPISRRTGSRGSSEPRRESPGSFWMQHGPSAPDAPVAVRSLAPCRRRRVVLRCFRDPSARPRLAALPAGHALWVRCRPACRGNAGGIGKDPVDH